MIEAFNNDQQHNLKCSGIVIAQNVKCSGNIGVTMKYTISELRKVLEERKRDAVDIVSPFGMMHGMDDEVILSLDDHGTYNISPFAHNNIAILCNIPKMYYDHLLDEAPDILCTIVNRFSNDEMLCRISGGKIRAILSNHYMIIDNHELITLVIECLPAGMKGYEGTVTDTRMNAKFIGNGTVTVGDHTLTPGVAIQNSEIGTGAVRVDMFVRVNDLDCGMIIRQPTARIHLGRKVDTGIVDVTEGPGSVREQVERSVEFATDPKTIGAVAAAIRANALQPVDKPVDTVNRIARNARIKKDDTLQLLNRFLDKSIKTRWHLAVATATTAALVGDTDKATALERLAGMIATDRGASVQTALT